MSDTRATGVTCGGGGGGEDFEKGHGNQGQH